MTSDEAVLREIPSLDLNTAAVITSSNNNDNNNGNSSGKMKDGVSSNSKYGIDDPLVSSSSSSNAATATFSSPTSSEKRGKGKEISDDGQVIYWSVDDAEVAKDIVSSKPVDADQMVWFEMDVSILGRLRLLHTVHIMNILKYIDR